MSTTAVVQRYTPDDLLAMEDGHSYELIDGRFVEKNMGAKAGRVAARLISRIDRHAEEKGLGAVFTQDCGYLIFPEDPDRVRKPDFSFIGKGRLPNNTIPDGFVRIPPDLVGEVVSPNDLAEEVNARVVDYLAAGVPLIWVFYVPTRFVHIFRPDGSASYLTVRDTLSGEVVLPGFTCRVEEVFAGI
jgi:Uma2 family endonuclease